MRMVVKPHQAFFLAARTGHAAGPVPMPHRVPALLPSILSRPPPSPHPRLGDGCGGERMLGYFSNSHPTRSASSRPLVPRRRACLRIPAAGSNDRPARGRSPASPLFGLCYLAAPSTYGSSAESTVASLITRTRISLRKPPSSMSAPLAAAPQANTTSFPPVTESVTNARKMASKIKPQPPPIVA